VLRALDKCLHNTRHAVTRLLSKYIGMRRHLTPAEQLQTFLRHNHLEHLLRLIALQLILREEKHANTKITVSTKLNTERLYCFREKFVGYLQQNADTVSGLSFRILSCTVLQILYDL